MYSKCHVIILWLRLLLCIHLHTYIQLTEGVSTLPWTISAFSYFRSCPLSKNIKYATFNVTSNHYEIISNLEQRQQRQQQNVLLEDISSSSSYLSQVFFLRRRSQNIDEFILPQHNHILLASTTTTAHPIFPVRECTCLTPHPTYCPIISIQPTDPVFNACAQSRDGMTQALTTCFVSPRLDLYLFARSTWPLIVFLLCTLVLFLTITQTGKGVRKCITRQLIVSSLSSSSRRRGRRRWWRRDNETESPTTTTSISMADILSHEADIVRQIVSSTTRSESPTSTSITNNPTPSTNGGFFQQWFGSNEAEVERLIEQELYIRHQMLESSYMAGIRTWLRIHGLNEETDVSSFIEQYRRTHEGGGFFHPDPSITMAYVLKTKKYVSPTKSQPSPLLSSTRNVQSDDIQQLETADDRAERYTNDETNKSKDSDEELLQDDVCTICYNIIENGEKVGALTCNHNFHVECLTIWIQRRNGTFYWRCFPLY